MIHWIQLVLGQTLSSCASSPSHWFQPVSISGISQPRPSHLFFPTPRCRRTSDRRSRVRRRWLCIWHRRSSEYPLGTPCRKEDRTDTRVLPSLSHVMQSVAAGHLTEFPGCPISPPSPLSTST